MTLGKAQIDIVVPQLSIFDPIANKGWSGECPKADVLRDLKPEKNGAVTL